MTTNSGIEPSTALAASVNHFLQDPEGPLVAVLAITPELQLTVEQMIPSGGSLEHDMGLLQNYLPGEECRYVIIRNDGKGGSVLVAYTPDGASVRNKMIYASTKASLLKSLALADTMMVSSIEELSWAEWQKHWQSKNIDQHSLMSESERQLASVKQSELIMQQQHQQQKHQLAYTSSSTGLLLVNLPSILETPSDLSKGQLLTLKITNEDSLVIDQDQNGISLNNLGEHLDDTGPAYYLYADANGSSVYFIYACPSGSKVRDRMIYATNKGPLVNYLKQNNWELVEILEIGDKQDLSFSETKDTDGQANRGSSNGRAFAKPKGPRRR